MFSRLIHNRIQKLADGQLLEVYSGSRSNRSTIDRIFTLKMTNGKKKGVE